MKEIPPWHFGLGLNIGTIARELPRLSAESQPKPIISCELIESETTDKLGLKFQFRGISLARRRFMVAQGLFLLPGSDSGIYARLQDNKILLLATADTKISCEVWLSQLDPDPIYWQNFSVPALAECNHEMGVTILSPDKLKLGYTLR